MSTLYLCGTGNAEGIRLAIRVNDALGCWQRIVLLDDNADLHGARKLGLGIAGAFDLLQEADQERDEVVNLVTRTTEGRARARERIASFGVPFASLVHPSVDLLGAELAEEVSVYANAYIGAEAKLARSSVVLVGGLVGHGAQLGEGCIIAPKAVINARVNIGAGAYIGSHATVLPDLVIGEGATVAANSAVFSDVPAGATAIGVPASVMPQEGQPEEDFSARAVSSRPRSMAHTDSEIAPAIGDADALTSLIQMHVQRLLGLERVPVHDNFFDLGGTSLKALQLWQALRDEGGLQLQLLDLYRHPSVKALAQHLAGGSCEPMAAARQRAVIRRQRMRR